MHPQVTKHEETTRDQESTGVERVSTLDEPRVLVVPEGNDRGRARFMNERVSTHGGVIRRELKS